MIVQAARERARGRLSLGIEGLPPLPSRFPALSPSTAAAAAAVAYGNSSTARRRRRAETLPRETLILLPLCVVVVAGSLPVARTRGGGG